MKRVGKVAMVIFCGLALSFLMQTFVFKNASVSGDSMSPTLEDGEKMIINRLIYKVKDPIHDDIVVFPDTNEESKFYVKRIIGVPHDTIDIRNAKIYRNDVPLSDEFSYDTTQLLGDITYPVTVPEDEYFVLGDNRNVSHDSRSSDIGFIKKSDILGRVTLKIWPNFGKIGG